MIPTLGLMIAAYGCARLINDIFARYPESAVADGMTIVVSLVGIAALVLLAADLYMTGATVTEFGL